MDQEYWQEEQKLNKRKERQEKNIDKYSKSKIKKTISTSLNTVGVGALSSFESFFGELWLHGKDYNELTDRQKDIRDKWLDCRDEILQRTAVGIKISFKEIDRCEIKAYQEKRQNIIIKNKENRGNENGRG